MLLTFTVDRQVRRPGLSSSHRCECDGTFELRQQDQSRRAQPRLQSYVLVLLWPRRDHCALEHVGPKKYR